ncbi:type II toxin-antitoxin system HipA family toxin [Specibacter cremeus]|uniref:type II toxin-antitoxin system HipA family toxin n=1 Tax=Specibacter cremeus TaxID=1629051 RepID=UPI000F78F6CA|nr:HipA domain-containing protein [Specibacter cremeus]
MVRLRVELYGHLIGWLTGTGSRTFDFETDRAAFEHYELGSTVLSESVPLELRPVRAKAGRRRNYFAELLPEGRNLANLARQAGTREGDVLGLLTHYGRDVAGAVQIHDPEQPGEPRTPRATPISDAGIAELLRDTAASPLGNERLFGKTSLAGVQEKIVLARIDGAWHRALDGFPSTHILKPVSRDYPTIIFDEEYGARAARRLGLVETRSWLEDFSGRPALVIERYDRSPAAPLGRIHQEDMSQALGAGGDEKYQEYGGKVSFQRVAGLLRKNGMAESTDRLFRQMVLSVALGNLDMHTKNLGLLHFPDTTTTLAPAYDMVPMRHFRNDGRMALAVNSVYAHQMITRDDLIAEGQSWGLNHVAAKVDEALNLIAMVVSDEAPDPRAHDGLQADILGFARNLLAGKPTGDLSSQ